MHYTFNYHKVLHRTKLLNLPSHFDPACTKYLTVTGMRVSYNGPGRTDMDASSVITDVPIPVRCALYYFEIEIVDSGKCGYIGVGLSRSSNVLNKLPGWVNGSIGYHGDDGMLFKGDGQGERYGPTFSVGDVIGCCYNLVTNETFFTKNGERLAPAVKFSNAQMLYPCVGMRTLGEVIEVNLGQRPFLFDIESYARQVKNEVYSTIKIQTLHDESHRVIHNLIIDALFHTRNFDAFDALIRETPEGIINYQEDIVAAHDRRKKAKALLFDRKYSELYTLLYSLWKRGRQPLAEEHVIVLLLVRCQQFLEMVRNATSRWEHVLEDEEIVEMGKVLCTQLTNDKLLKQIVAMFAYKDLSNCPYAHVLHEDYREVLFEIVDKELAQWYMKETTSRVAKIANELDAIVTGCRHLAYNEVVHCIVDEMLNSGKDHD